MTDENIKALLKQVATQFRQMAGIPVKITIVNEKQIKLQLEWQNQIFKLNGIVAPTVTQGNLGVILLQFSRTDVKTVLITRYVNAQMAERLKSMHIAFMDAAGNVYLNVSPIYLYVKGNKPDVNIRVPSVRRVFRPAGLQIVFALLCNPGLEAQPLRTIARKAGVALGTVVKVIQDLKDMQFLLDNGRKNRKLLRKKDLLERWVIAYPDHLRPKLILDYYEPHNTNWWKEVDLTNYQALWSSEVAGWKLTKYLKPQQATLYATQIPKQLLIDYKMKKKPNGTVEILRKFWDFETDNAIVPPILIYADLIATGHARNIEVGKMIYEKEIAQYIGED